MERVADQVAVGADQAEVDAPGVDADARQRRPPPPAADVGVADRLPQPGLQLFPLGEEVPVEVAVHPAGGVGEAVALFELEPVGAEGPEHGAPALGAQVEGEEMLRRHVRVSPVATPVARRHGSKRSGLPLSRGQERPQGAPSADVQRRSAFCLGR